MSEQVLVFPQESLFPFVNLFKAEGGIVTDPTTVDAVLEHVLAAEQLSYMDRATAEEEPRFKQVIPYCVLVSNLNGAPRYFTYQRTKKGGETRLHSKSSIGVGGHINPIDGHVLNQQTYHISVARELKEEVGLVIDPETVPLEPAALIYDPTNTVGEVHFGVVHFIDVGNQMVTTTDPALSEGLWLTLRDLTTTKSLTFENWSQLIVTSGILV